MTVVTCRAVTTEGKTRYLSLTGTKRNKKFLEKRNYEHLVGNRLVATLTVLVKLTYLCRLSLLKRYLLLHKVLSKHVLIHGLVLCNMKSIYPEY